MKKNIIILILLTLTLPISANNVIRGRVFDTNNDPLVGATVRCKQTNRGVATNNNGFFELQMAAGASCIIVSFTGFVAQELHNVSFDNELTITLIEDAQLLEEFVFTQRAIGTVMLRDAVQQTQRISRTELCRAACCNLSESFETNASVDVSFSDAATGARQIRLLGLDGFYIQMLTENLPNFRGVAQPFGMDYIPGSWIESISISKGTSSVRNGFEALAGQINVEYKKPTTMDRLFVNLYASEAGRYEANVVSGLVFNPRLSTGLFFHYSQQQREHDKHDNGFMAEPISRQLGLMNRWHYRTGRYGSQYVARFTNETRESGQLSSIPDPFRISFNTNRGEFFTKQSLMIDDGDLPSSVALVASASLHDQRSMFGTTQFDVNQRNIYLSAMYDNHISNHHSIITGLSMNHDGFSTTLNDNERLRPIVGNRSIANETVFGGFAEYTFNFHNELVLMGGIRGDYSNLHGFFVTPRMHLRYTPREWINLRGSIGKGFRTAHVLAENNFLLASSRQINIADNLEQERAWNTGFNVTFYIPIGHRELIIAGEYYHTRFINQVVIDRDSDPNTVFFYNLNGRRSFTNVTQIEVSYSFFEGFTLMAAYRYNRAQTEFRHPITGEDLGLLSKPLQSNTVGIATASYLTPRGRWQFDLTGQFNGGGRMPTPNPDNPLWTERFDPFNVFLGQITKNFTNLSIYAGVENIFNFRQEHPIIDPQNPLGENFDATMIWGPLKGRKAYIGLRWNIPQM